MPAFAARLAIAWTATVLIETALLARWLSARHDRRVRSFAGVWLSALNVKYRDVKYIVPFFTRIGLYVTPVGFASALIFEKFGSRIFFAYCLNPMVGVIDGFRWCILDNVEFYWPGFAVSLFVVVLFLWLGIRQFRRTERVFADMI